jgi:hypothetical protein
METEKLLTIEEFRQAKMSSWDKNADKKTFYRSRIEGNNVIFNRFGFDDVQRKFRFISRFTYMLELDKDNLVIDYLVEV